MTPKRAFDIAASASAILLLSPIIAAATLASAVEHKSWPIYSVDRAGKDGIAFSMYKLKTMNDTRDANGNLLPDEQRVTKFGSFLRKAGIDELPQLFNILVGNMSVVGPRPRTADLRGGDYVPEQYSGIFNVRPGLTGAWQVAVIGRKGMSAQEKLDLELDYAKRPAQLSEDLKLIAKTVPSFYRGHGGETFGK